MRLRRLLSSGTTPVSSVNEPSGRKGHVKYRSFVNRNNPGLCHRVVVLSMACFTSIMIFRYLQHPGGFYIFSTTPEVRAAGTRPPAPSSTYNSRASDDKKFYLPEYGLPNHKINFCLNIKPASKILITGILSSPVAFQLAIDLVKICKLQRIWGVDPVLPNKIELRQKYSQRYQILQQYYAEGFFFKSGSLHPRPAAGYPGRGPLYRIHFDYVIHLQSAGTMPFSNCMTIRQVLLSLEDVFDLCRWIGKVSKTPPLLIYASRDASIGGDGFAGELNEIDRVIATFAKNSFGFKSVAIRLPELYGPFGRKGDAVYDLTEAIIHNRELENASELDWDSERAFVSVDNAVESIFRVTVSYSKLVNLHSEYSLNPDVRISLSEMKEEILGAFKGLPSPRANSRVPILDARNFFLKLWAPSNFQDGLHKLLTWHVSNSDYYATPSANYPSHLWGDKSDNDSGYYDCVSECANTQRCKASDMDNIRDLTLRLTTNCEYVMYTVNLEKDLSVLLEIGDSQQQKQLCLMAFVAGDSSLAEQNLPAYHGWSIIVVPRSYSNYMTLKLSPGKFFSPNVIAAMHVGPRQTLITPEKALHMMQHMNDIETTSTKTTTKMELIQSQSTSTAKKVVIFSAPLTTKLSSIPLLKQDASYQLQKNEFIQNNMWRECRNFNMILPIISTAEWHIHSFNLEESRKFRCEWLAEEVLTWKGGLEDLSLKGVFLKRMVLKFLEEDKIYVDFWNIKEIGTCTTGRHELHFEGGDKKMENGNELVIRIPKHAADFYGWRPQEPAWPDS